jgi:hypothetical protein
MVDNPILLVSEKGEIFLGCPLVVFRQKIEG